MVMSVYEGTEMRDKMEDCGIEGVEKVRNLP